jgi:hypothetical protein
MINFGTAGWIRTADLLIHRTYERILRVSDGRRLRSANNASAVVSPTRTRSTVDTRRAAAVGSDCAGPLQPDKSVGREARALLLPLIDLLPICYLATNVPLELEYGSL